MTRILLLGGTTEANDLAKRLSAVGADAIYSYAGRTQSPVAQPLPTRVGGFSGVPGLLRYLQTEQVTHIVDATHPFATGMSENAAAAAAQACVSLIRLERLAWAPQTGDSWTMLGAVDDIPAALPNLPARVFLAIGKQQLHLFAVKPQHHYLLRLVDQPDAPLPLPNTSVLVARGPFTAEGDIALLREHRITHIVAKNAGGLAARAKLDAARALGLPVIMAERPTLPKGPVADSVAQVMAWLGHTALRGV